MSANVLFMVNNSEYTHRQKRFFQIVLDTQHTQQTFESLDEQALKISFERLT